MHVLVQDQEVLDTHREIVQSVLMRLMSRPGLNTIYKVSKESGLSGAVIKNILNKSRYSIGPAIEKLIPALIKKNIYTPGIPDSEFKQDLEKLLEIYKGSSGEKVRKVNPGDVKMRDIRLTRDLRMKVKPWFINRESLEVLRGRNTKHYTHGVVQGGYLRYAERNCQVPALYKIDPEGHGRWLDRYHFVTIARGSLVRHGVSIKQRWHQITVLESQELEWVGLTFQGQVLVPQAVGYPVGFVSDIGQVPSVKPIGPEQCEGYGWRKSGKATPWGKKVRKTYTFKDPSKPRKKWTRKDPNKPRKPWTRKPVVEVSLDLSKKDPVEYETEVKYEEPKKAVEYKTDSRYEYKEPKKVEVAEPKKAVEYKTDIRYEYKAL